MMSGYSDFQANQKASSGAARRAVRKAGGKPKAPKPKAHRPHKGAAPAYNVLDDPNAVTAPQTLRQIYKGADTAANLRYGPQERAIGLQKAQVPAWFQSYRDQVQGIQTGVKSGYDQAVKDIGTRQAAVDATDNSGRAALLAAAQKDAASRGASVDPSMFAKDVGAQTVRGQGQSDFANLLTAQVNANNNYFGGLQTASSGGELAQKKRLGSEATALAGDKGLFKNQYVTDTAQQAHTNRLADAAFNIPTANAQLSAQTQRQRLKVTSKNQAAQRKATSRTERNTPITSGPFAGLTHQQVRALTPSEKQHRTDAFGKGKGTGTGNTDQQKQLKAKRDTSSTALGRLDDINGRWHSYRTQTITEMYTGSDGKKHDRKRPPNPNDVTNRILGEAGQGGHKFTATELHLARLLREHKRFSQNDVDIAHRLGISVPGKLRPLKPSQINQKYATNRP